MDSKLFILIELKRAIIARATATSFQTFCIDFISGFTKHTFLTLILNRGKVVWNVNDITGQVWNTLHHAEFQAMPLPFNFRLGRFRFGSTVTTWNSLHPIEFPKQSCDVPRSGCNLRPNNTKIHSGFFRHTHHNPFRKGQSH